MPRKVENLLTRKSHFVVSLNVKIPTCGLESILMKNAITREQMEELLKSKYVYKVTMQKFLFTKEFVLKFYNEIAQGKSPIKIFADAGIPLVPHITDNIRNLKRRMVNAVEKNLLKIMQEYITRKQKTMI